MELTETYPVSTVCQALNLPRSSYYYARRASNDRSQRGSEEDLRTALLREAEAWPTYGYRRITAQLRRQGRRVNGKKVRRLMREMGLQVRKKVQKRRTTDSRHDFARFPNLIRQLEITHPDQGAGTATAAAFLKAFVEDAPWAHLDIAGTAWTSNEKPYVPKGGSGFGVRLLIDYLKTL